MQLNTAALLGACALLPLSPAVQAESAPERGLAAIKVLDYLDSQPGASRVRVKAAAASVMNPINSEWSFAGSTTVDAISGASPYLQTTALTPLRDERRAIDAQVTRYLPWGTVSVGGNFSTEQDYLSRGATLSVAHSDESRNTTWTFGLAHNADVINPSTRVVDHERKRVTGLMVGLTQVLTPRDIVQVNVSRNAGRGYYSDPYKFADDRPRQRDADVLMVRWNHHSESMGTTWRWSWRHFRDNWAVRSHTVGLEASLYPFAPLSAGPYSEDQRLSAFGALTMGLKVARRLDEDWTADLKFEGYEQRGAWSRTGTGTEGLLPFRARSIQVGLARAF